jgi:hypothetical protein
MYLTYRDSNEHTNATSAAGAGEAGAPEKTDSLELRLERIKRLSNASLEFLKRLYDRRPVAEQYLKGDCEVHLHFFARDRVYCARYRAARDVEEAKPIGISKNAGLNEASMECKLAVFVGTGEALKRCRPIDSVVRLQSLDCCYMGGIEAVEPSTLFPPLESLLLVFDRELSSIDASPGIERGKLIDQIIEGGSKIVCDFADDNTDLDRNSEPLINDELRFAKMVRVCIPFQGTSLFLFLPESFTPCYKIKNVFACPRGTGKRAV